MWKKIKFKKETIFFSFTFVLFIGLFLFSVMGYASSREADDVREGEVLDKVEERLMSLFFEVNNFPGNAGNDILFLSKLSSLNNFLKSGEDVDKSDLESDFFEFLKENSAYYKIGFVNLTSRELIGVEFDGEEYNFFSEEERVEKDDFFTRTSLLEKNEVFISPITLSFKSNVLENRGTLDEPSYIPVLKYSTPVLNEFGEVVGSIVSDVYADYFLEDIRNFQRNEEQIFLINSEGYYLAHENRSKEFGFITGSEENFLNDFVGVGDEILSTFDKRRFESDEYVFVVRYIYPTISTFRLYKGSQKVFGDNSENKFFWVLVNALPKEEFE